MKADDLQRRLPEAQQCAMAQAREKGGSSTLTTIPVAEHIFSLIQKLISMTMSTFVTAGHWTICPPSVRVENDLQWTKPRSAVSGFIHMQHNDLDFLASCMKEVHNNVEVEPKLQPLMEESLRHCTVNTDHDARADIRVRGFWTQGSNAFFDTRFFYPYV